MKRRPFIFLALGLLALTTPASAADPIRFGVAAEPYPPIASKNAAGEWEGFDIDLMHAVCDEMKARCEIFETAWDGIIPGLQARKFDVIWASMAITDKRREVVDFTVKLYETPPVWVGPKTFSKDLTKPEEIKGLTVGTQTGTVNVDYLTATYGDKITIKTYDTADAALADLIAGRSDLVVSDAITAMSLLGSSSESYAILAPIKGDPKILGYGIGGGVRKGETDLLDRLNAAFERVRASGKYQEIAARYFKDFDIYNP